jgi:hypothetical protein
VERQTLSKPVPTRPSRSSLDVILIYHHSAGSNLRYARAAYLCGWELQTIWGGGQIPMPQTRPEALEFESSEVSGSYHLFKHFSLVFFLH